jgi:hypothetical protein
MSQSSVYALTLATAVLPQLQLIASQSAQSSLRLSQQVSALVAGFLCRPPTPASTLDFENDLRLLLDEFGRLILEATFNQIEPPNPQEAPKHVEHDRQDYSRKNQKSPNRGGIGTLFGTIELRRCLYEPLQEARDDRQRSFSPLELGLGIVAGNATPALAERVGRLSSGHTQEEMRELLKGDHHVNWSVKTLRAVAAAVSSGIAPYLRAAQRDALLGWLAEAEQSTGRYRIALSVGRDGIMLPIRYEETNKEASVATISVYDRRGRRLGTLYLGEMPQALQLALSEELTGLLKEVLTNWKGSMPRLVYITDAGFHPTAYFEDVLRKMENPREAGKLLEWMWIVDFYHAASYVSRLAKVLFSEEKTQQAWARRMRHLMRDKKGGVMRVLSSAAQYHTMKVLDKKEEKEYAEAYNYLLKHSPEMQYSEYRRVRLPIGSGVTEAGCKIVFTQRFKQSGMTWGLEGGEVILRLRLAVLSGVWDVVYRNYLNNRPLATLATQLPVSSDFVEKAA